ncbi:hypothetical protein [Undibacterium sp.]|uniref:hypothetical protein n=1 Tax=Undibacterium sp. TaxID=1914977 RepID=UPI00374CB76D
MSWLIRVGSAGFEQDMNAGVITSKIRITSNDCHTFAQLSLSPNAGKTTSGKASSNPTCHTEQVWQNVLSTLVGV